MKHENLHKLSILDRILPGNEFTGQSTLDKIKRLGAERLNVK